MRTNIGYGGLFAVAAASFVVACGAGAAAGSKDETEDTRGVAAEAAPSLPGAENGASPTAPLAATKRLSPEVLARMNGFLENRLQKSAVRAALKSAAGRRVDCVDIDAQPGLKGQTRALPPPAPERANDLSATERLVAPEPLFDVSVPGVAATCPAGTVPIQAVTLEDLSRFDSVDDYFRKYPAHRETGVANVEPPIAPAGHTGPTSKHQYAHAARPVTNWGARATFNVWNSATEKNEEFSLGQIWVAGGAGNTSQTLEVGFQHYNGLYGDNDLHLFIYSTRDGYTNTSTHPGCYNNSCGDFVQVSTTWFPGAKISATSVSGGTQNILDAEWLKAGDTGEWWLRVQNEWVGYYPRSTFSTVANHAERIDFGGEIIDNQTGGRHTTTDMGSGALPSAGWQKAAFMRDLRYNNANPSGQSVTFLPATGLTPTRTDAACYDISVVDSTDPTWKSYFFYGGPGYVNPTCL